MVNENYSDLKKSKRSFYLEEIKKISPEDKANKSNQIAAQLQKKLKLQSGLWTGYQAFPSEPKIEWTILSQKIKWCFPVVEDEVMHFQFVDGKKARLSEISGFVIPGLAFDQSGIRLGRGGGYYDRTLAQHAGQKIGVCFNVSFCQHLPAEAHDVRLDTVITDQEIYEINKTDNTKSKGS